ncbi:MAG TPA: phosphomannomutase/phosphoglucomutase [Kiritimatiellia bacterium]|nr:phosphomannomutase/phosphoglucomutase [Kiritimatiellia bacterium]HMO99447.1 phosphomannomutase/phosphoglucomutase [Kiritimatiellia bacterium]HMP97265.1 phosphomannomutase/phosphoglucomutase [Kiritimatiellia bacterium]
MGSIFKAYDIRGIYGKDLDEALAGKIGRAFATFLGCKKVVIGHDMRPHSVPLFKALADGLMQQGVEVINIGLCSTPMSYYANGKLGADASIMLTASHNPGEWNGFKLCREQAIPISGVTGIKDIEKIVLSESFAPASGGGKVTEVDIVPDYIEHIRSFADLKRPLRVAIDFANAMGIVENKVLEGLVSIDPLFDTLDGTFPNHEANPLLEETWEALQHKVRNGNYDFAVAYDGDADRAGFMDEKGDIIPMDMITALIAEMVLKRDPGASIFYDLRSSWAVKEVIEANGGKPMMSRVGHAFIKQQMREHNAVFAGELSGHYYFKENYFAESSSLAALYVANLLSDSDATMSELIRPIQKYFASGEINSEVEDTRRVFQVLREKYGHGKVIELDGLSVEFDDWWFNVRASNTEPLIRLNLEAKSRDQMIEKRDTLLALIRG